MQRHPQRLWAARRWSAAHHRVGAEAPARSEARMLFAAAKARIPPFEEIELGLDCIRVR